MTRQKKTPTPKTTVVRVIENTWRNYFVKGFDEEDEPIISQAMDYYEAINDGAGMTRKKASEVVEVLSQRAPREGIQMVVVFFKGAPNVKRPEQGFINRRKKK